MNVNLTPDEAQALLDGINLVERDAVWDGSWTQPITKGSELTKAEVIKSARRKVQAVR